MRPQVPDGGFRPSVSAFDPDEGRRAPRRRTDRKRDGQNGAAVPKRPAFKRIVQLCSVRDRSRQEIRERLDRDGYPVDEAERALCRAVECGLVDDLRFADAFVRARIFAGKGELAIERDLQRHGIALAELPGWPVSYGYDEQGQVEAATRFLQAHPPKAKDAWGAAYRKLVGKGYSGYVSSKAARIWQEQIEREA